MKRPILALLAVPFVSGVFAASPPPVPPGMAVATFAGGCFWCMEPPHDKLPGRHDLRLRRGPDRESHL
jgi:peptide-methionine (S)-S-oxide reductase